MQTIRKFTFTHMLYMCTCFCVVLVTTRIILTGTLLYAFLLWNIFLAFIPFWLSEGLYKKKSVTKKSLVMLLCWLLFFPNAPYIITDLFHLKDRPPIPKWYDLIILITAAWIGVLLSVTSLMKIEAYLLAVLNKVKTQIILTFCLLLTGYGIYIGRYLRFNSWDIMTDAKNLFNTILHHIIFPLEHKYVWIFSVLFGSLLGIFFQTIKMLQQKGGKV